MDAGGLAATGLDPAEGDDAGLDVGAADDGADGVGLGPGAPDGVAGAVDVGAER